jgi:hypothetical protein
VKRPGAAGADATEKPPVPPDPQAVAAARRKAMMGLKQVHFTVDYQYLSLDGGAVLPDSNVALPEDLHDIKGSVSYSHMVEPRRLWGFRASIGSASDSPFASSDVIAVNGLGFYMHPSRKRDAWVFFLHYSNTRSLLNHVPLPGVAYFWRPNREFQLLAGIPFLFARWRPTKQWEFSVLGTPAPSGTVQAKFRPSRAAELYAALRLAVGDGFLREDREEDRERLYASANRAELGADIHLSRHLRLGVAGGYAFDRFIYEGEGFDERDENRIDLNDAAYGLVRLKARW